MMRRFLAFLALVSLLVPMAVSAADPLGPPKASLAPGRLALGIEYAYSNLQLVEVTGLGTSRVDIEDMHATYLTLSMGVVEWLEVFVRAGGVTMDGTQTKRLGQITFDYDCDYDLDMIYGAGLRVTLGSVGNVTFGAVGSFSYAEVDGDSRGSLTLNVPPPGGGTFIRSGRELGDEVYVAVLDMGSDVDAEMQQITVGLGATWQVLENFAIYGGGLFHHVRIKQESDGQLLIVIKPKGGGTQTRDLPTGSDSTVFKNDDGGSVFGGYAGLRWGINESLSLCLEGSYAEDSIGGSAMLGWAF